MPYYYVHITYVSRNTSLLNTIGGYDMSEDSVRQQVVEPFQSQMPFVFAGFVIDPRLIERINVYETEKHVKDILLDHRKAESSRAISISYEEHFGSVDDILEGIRKGKIGKEVTSRFITSVSRGARNEQASEIFKVISLIENNLRKVIRSRPNREDEINDALENLFIGAGLDKDFSREKESIPYSSKKYIPDFVFRLIDTIVETKFCDKEGKDKQIISQINDDIVAYKTRYPNLIFVIYDVGIIRNVDRFKNSIENQQSVIVKVIKH